jgi:DNA-binding MarR family transcriptional regulator
MNGRRYNLPHLAFLQGFEAAARTLSFTKAAEELFVTQSAVSRQIKALEDNLGLRLFERRPRSLALTENGQALYRIATDVFDRLGLREQEVYRAHSEGSVAEQELRTRNAHMECFGTNLGVGCPGAPWCSGGAGSFMSSSFNRFSMLAGREASRTTICRRAHRRPRAAPPQ